MRLRNIFLTLIVMAPEALARNAALPLSSVQFEENGGQTSEAARFIARARGHQAYFTSRGAVFALPGGGSFTLEFAGTGDADWHAEAKPCNSISYLIGNDPSKWVKNAPVYERIVWRDSLSRH